MVTTQIIRSRSYTSKDTSATQAILAGDFVYLSGVLPMDYKTNQVVVTSISQQVEQIFSNIRITLGTQSLRLENLVKITVYLASNSISDSINELHEALKRTFGDRIPAKTIVFVDRLPEGVTVCIDGIAYIERD